MCKGILTISHCIGKELIVFTVVHKASLHFHQVVPFSFVKIFNVLLCILVIG